MKNTPTYREQFDADLAKFAMLTKDAKTAYKKDSHWLLLNQPIVYPLRTTSSASARLENDIWKAYDYQRKLLAQQANAAVIKSYQRFISISSIFMTLKKFYVGETSITEGKTSDAGVTITLDTPFLSVTHDIPVRGHVQCIISLDRIAQYSKGNGPSTSIVFSVGDQDITPGLTTYTLWIQDQTREEILAEFKKQLTTIVSNTVKLRRVAQRIAKATK